MTNLTIPTEMSSPSLGPYSPLGTPHLSPRSDSTDRFFLKRSTKVTSSATAFPPMTKIICTIGPSTNSVENLNKLMIEGMTCARMNFSHGSHEYHLNTITNLRECVAKSKRLCAIMLDTKGPEIRTGPVENGKDIELVAGQEFVLECAEQIQGTSAGVFVQYPNLPKIIKVGANILIDDGLIELKVVKINETNVVCKVVNAGLLGGTKGVNLPGVIVDLPAVTDKDIADIMFGVEQGVDCIAASFVRNAAGVRAIRKLLGEAGATIKIISKIENQEGMDNFDEILEASDGIMVARGDLGVEIPIEQVALAQKMMIRKCNLSGKIVVTATQMLDSMIVNPSPTRAEASDVANAVFDGTDCVMLSGETAKGKYPYQAVRIMAEICREAEANMDNLSTYNATRSAMTHSMTIPEAISSSAVKTSFDLDAALLVVLTESGTTSRFVAKYRPKAPVLCITASEKTARQLLLSRGLLPLLVGSMSGSDSLISRAIGVAQRLGMCASGDIVIATVGHLECKPGMTSALKVVNVV